MPQFLIPSGAMQTTAVLATIALTSATLKTILQVKPGATIIAKISEWGVSFDSAVLATPGAIELVETDVAGTVTATAAADITKLDSDALMGGDPTTALIAVGTTSTGYNCSSEGSITAIRNLDAPSFIEPIGAFKWQFPLGDEPVIQAGKFARIRCKVPTGVNCYGYMKLRI